VVPITIYGNHSLPNLFAQVFPGSGRLALPSRILSSGAAVGLVVGAMIAFRRVEDERQRVAQVAAIAVLMLIIPVYTYEHSWACSRAPQRSGPRPRVRRTPRRDNLR
jgi:hypothetical protein